ncbi:hypothetical protein C9374_003305 [Naegleria lovaniensis]|uniref:Uncharacterized protein n=1 Tax=Naegleria lovaniensis TaxID=51637 RepID=A0AA88GML4_NAELO|nr:uncharacterized protein C9374_003305 [Naegleria lovaniensis]KAG2385490.1 hypothetical protein C9374_003305 [Naegleria lovaniensis]
MESAELSIVTPTIPSNIHQPYSEGRRLSATSPLLDSGVEFQVLDESKSPSTPSTTTTTQSNHRISSPKSPSSIQVPLFNDENNNNLNNNNNSATSTTAPTIGKILDDQEFKIFSHLSKLGRGKHDASDSFAEDTPFYTYEEGFNSSLKDGHSSANLTDTTTTVEEHLDSTNTTTITSGSSPSSNSIISSNNSATSSGDQLTTQIQIFSNATGDGDLISDAPIQITVDVVTTTTTTTTTNNNEEEHTTFVWQGSSVTTTTAEIQYHPSNIKSIVNTSVVSFEGEDEDEKLNAPPTIKQIIPGKDPLRGSTVIQIDEEHFHEISLGEIPALDKSANQVDDEEAHYYESMSCFSCFAQPISYLWNSIFETNQTELTTNEKIVTNSEKNFHSNNQPQEV